MAAADQRWRPESGLLGYFVMGRVADERRLGETRKNGEDTQ